MVAFNTHFAIGQIVLTPAAFETIRACGQQPLEFIRRHQRLDPGALDDEDQQANKDAVTNGGRIFSSYLLKDGSKIWIITEADRTSTTILLPDEY